VQGVAPALRVLCERLIDAGMFGGAVLAANGAVNCEPLDEQAYRLLVRAHLAAGNKAEAIRRYRAYEQMLKREFGLQPSAEMQQLIAEIA
jgi:DNA-binding SARP family transcriptional activator